MFQMKYKFFAEQCLVFHRPANPMHLKYKDVPEVQRSMFCDGRALNSVAFICREADVEEIQRKTLFIVNFHNKEEFYFGALY